MRITESTLRVSEGSYFAFCSSVLSPEGKDQVGRKKEQSANCQEAPRSSTMSPNDPEHDDAEGWCKMAMNYTKRMNHRVDRRFRLTTPNDPLQHKSVKTINTS
uniref:Uncharacterized protein n=1 Tax=Solanum tuberosum TaxID=4113 RepID=M1DTP6_SOLTU